MDRWCQRRRYPREYHPRRIPSFLRCPAGIRSSRPERIVMDTVRLYAEFSGTLVPAMDVEGTRKATEEYNGVKASKR